MVTKGGFDLAAGEGNDAGATPVEAGMFQASNCSGKGLTVLHAIAAGVTQ